MKKFTLYTLVLSSCTFTYASQQEVFGRSFMFTRPAYQHLAMQQALWHEVMHTKLKPNYNAFQVIGYYQQSTPLDKTERYFLINNKNELLVSGDANLADRRMRDIRAEWIGLSNSFQGLLRIKPKQHQFGVQFTYNQDLKKFFESSFLKDLWFNIAIPISIVENDLNLTQQVSNRSSTTPHDIIEAFRQPTWSFSRIEGKKHEINVAEITLSLGRALIDKEHIQIASESLFIIPVAHHQNPRILFDPVVGNDRHVGLGAVVYFQFPINRDISEYALNFFLNLSGIFQIRNKQKRTFDLIDKPFSRFMLFVKQNSAPDDLIPGVNILTLPTLVRSYGVFDFSTGWRLRWENFEGELSYNVWGHDSERLELRRPFAQPFGIAGQDPIIENNLPPIAATASQSTIANRAATDKDNQGDPTFVSIRMSDIDLRSAASGSALNHKVQVALGRLHDGKVVDGFFGFGAFVDIPQKNASLRTWGLWGKLGASF